MKQVEQLAAAQAFVERWQAAEGNEQREGAKFWIELVGEVLGLSNPTYALDFERKVRGRRIDVFCEDRGILIEHKSRGVDLDAPEQRGKNRDGSPRMVTPYDQAKWYADNLPRSIRPRWLLTCNFDEIRIYDMEEEYPERSFERVTLRELPELTHRLSFFTAAEGSRLEREKELSIKAGAVVGKLYDGLSKRYLNIETDAEEQRSLNILITRLVFILYCEDAGLFDEHQAFYRYLQKFPVERMRQGLIDLFHVLDTPDGEHGTENERDPYLEETLAAFPYVNGGLFAEEIIVPQFDEPARFTLLQEASAGFDWKDISPTIFGAVFESTLNPETRRAGGIHFTSVENIHKVIDPLFLDDLKAEFSAIEGQRVLRDRSIDLLNFQRKLSKIRVLDPACGSGNFLTESYLALRALENRVLESLNADAVLDLGEEGGGATIRVTIDQFYGIEVNDFAVSVAKTALWIAEAQMAGRTAQLLYKRFDVFPLRNAAHITCANALRTDWNDILPAAECNYIIGNPPFYDARMQSKEQKAELQEAFHGAKNSGNIDYVAGWYVKAAEYMDDLPIRAAFVSTNSICQGEQVANIWKPIYDLGMRIDFAYDTFRWHNEANDQAHVFVIIVGFSKHAPSAIPSPTPVILSEAKDLPSCDAEDSAVHTTWRLTRPSGRLRQVYSPSAQNDGWKRTLFHHADPDAEPVVSNPDNINAYLSTAPDVFVWNRSKPLCDVPKIGIGNKPIDGGNYLFKDEERTAFLAAEPGAAKYFHRWLGSDEFLNNRPRSVLWLGDATPQELAELPLCRERIENVRQFRLASSSAPTQKLAETPTRFHVENMPQGTSILVPKVSSERRRYIPLGFIEPDTFCSDLVFLIPEASLYHFGVLHSQFHNAWMRVVAGRLKSDYRYSGGMVYNNFVWPDLEGSRPRQPESPLRHSGRSEESPASQPGRSFTPLRSVQDDEKGIRREIEHCAQAILDTRELYPDASLATLYDPDKMPDDLKAAHAALDAAVEAAYGVDFGGNEERIVAHLFKLYAEAT